MLSAFCPLEPRGGISPDPALGLLLGFEGVNTATEAVW
jgi:hypothetical protein